MSKPVAPRKSQQDLLKRCIELASTEKPDGTVEFTSYEARSKGKCQYDHDASADQLKTIEAGLRKHKV